MSGNVYPAVFNFNPRSREGSDGNTNVYDLIQSISIHAPARGATSLERTIKGQVQISIHAPARGATGNAITLVQNGDDFNPRSREGSDIRMFVYSKIFYKFQSTLPRGERRRVYICGAEEYDISIHAPARGATFTGALPQPQKGISIHAPARGATQ